VESLFTDDLVAILEAYAVEQPGGALAFDGDGTLWSGDIGEDFFEHFLDRHEPSPRAHRALLEEAERVHFGQGHAPASSDATAVARALYSAYRKGNFPEERVCEVMTWVCAGWTRTMVDEFANDVLERVDLTRRIHPETLAVVRWAQSLQITTYIVSASPRAVVEQAARRLGIEAAFVVSAKELYDANNEMAAAVARPIPYGEGKVHRLREKLGNATVYAAFGDNAFDIPMLREARVPIAIRPKERLLQRAGEVPGLRVLARPAYS